MREKAEDAIREYEQSNLTHRKRAQVNAGVHPIRFRFLIGDPAHPTSEATPVSYDKAVNGSVQEWREEQWRRQHAAQQQRFAVPGDDTVSRGGRVAKKTAAKRFRRPAD